MRLEIEQIEQLLMPLRMSLDLIVKVVTTKGDFELSMRKSLSVFQSFQLSLSDKSNSIPMIYIELRQWV